MGSLSNNDGPTETIPLGASSPAIDAIPNPTTILSVDLCAGSASADQRGVSRPQNGGKGLFCDIGAYELELPQVSISLSTGAFVSATTPITITATDVGPGVSEIGYCIFPGVGSTCPGSSTTVTNTSATPSPFSTQFSLRNPVRRRHVHDSVQRDRSAQQLRAYVSRLGCSAPVGDRHSRHHRAQRLTLTGLAQRAGEWQDVRHQGDSAHGERDGPRGRRREQRLGGATVGYRAYAQGGTPPAYSTAGGASASFTLGGLLSNPADGTYTIDYDSTDNVGNDPAHTVQMTLDDTPPTITISAPANNSVILNAGTLTLSFGATDSGAGMSGGLAHLSATLDGGSVSNGQGIDLAALSLTSHTLTVTATDAVGNTSTASATFRLGATGNGGAASGAQPVTPQGPTGGPVASGGNTASNSSGSGGAGSANTGTKTSGAAPQRQVASTTPWALFLIILLLALGSIGTVTVMQRRGLLHLNARRRS